MDFLISNLARDQYPDDHAQSVVATIHRVYVGEFLPRTQATPLELHYVKDHKLADDEDGLVIDPRSDEQYLGEHHLDRRIRAVLMLGACKQFNDNPDETMSHEIFEGGMDPSAKLQAEIDEEGTEEAWEACDAVQGTAKEVDGISIANFIIPFGYFCEIVGPDGYDWQKVLTAPHTKTPGGYRLFKKPGQQWTQDEGEKAPEHKRIGQVKWWHRRGQRIVRRGSALAKQVMDGRRLFSMPMANPQVQAPLEQALKVLHGCGPSREFSLVRTKIEEALLWLKAAERGDAFA